MSNNTSHLISCTDTSNITNEKINDGYEDVYDNDDKYDNNVLTYSSPAYKFVECEVSTSETRQVSVYKCQLMSMIYYRPQVQSLV